MSDTGAINRGTVGILYAGEMGSALGRLLAEQGWRVVTTLEDRSFRTCRLCREAGLAVVDSLAEVVGEADVVISLVVPSAALAVAEACCRVLPPRRPVYVDANSISPGTAACIGALLARSGVPFVDGSIHGLAAQLRTRATLYLSGPEAGALADRLGGALRVRVVGDEPGAASAFKMLLAGLSKGLVALFLEMGLLGCDLGLLDELLEGYRHYYPGIMEAVERLLPTYPRHAARRAEELAELEQTMAAAGATPCLVPAARRVIATVGRLRLPERPWEGLADLVEEIHRRRPLRAVATSGPLVG
jgi:3-hydroxyisobutyrate dehydrogenase-like beta-hydroxyacid dehydrogenase